MEIASHGLEKVNVRCWYCSPYCLCAHPGKVLAVEEDCANAHPNTHIALVKALLEACYYCADENNALEIEKILSQR